jgi:hypothetical protein
LLSARLLSTSAPGGNLEARYLVNGIERGLGGGANNVANNPLSWQHFCWVTGTVEEQVVRVQLREDAGTGTISGLRMLAFPLPEGADAHFFEHADVQAVTANVWADYLELSFEPESAGEYLVLALMSGSEAPGTGGLHVQMAGPLSDEQWQTTPYINHRNHFVVGMWSRTFTLSKESQVYQLQALGSGGEGSQIRDARMLAFRTDVFEPLHVVLDLQEITTESDQPVVVSSLQMSALITERDLIVFQNMFSKPVDEDPDLLHACHVIFRMDDEELAHSVRYNTASGPHASAGVFYALTTKGPILFENVVQSNLTDMPMQAGESAIVVLGLP